MLFDIVLGLSLSWPFIRLRRGGGGGGGGWWCGNLAGYWSVLSMYCCLILSVPK
jgi:hypothetical protein